MGFKEFIVRDRFKDKVTIVTGGGSGICRETALRFAKEGSSLVIPDINFEKAKETAKLVEDIGRKALPLSLDVSDTESVREMVRRTIDMFGKIDILINCAGIVTREALLDTTEERWNRELAVDLTGCAMCIKYVVPEMRKVGKGKIVNIASLAGIRGVVAPAYTAAKGGLVALTRVLAGEFAPYKININTVCPGFVATPLNEHVRKMGLERIIAEKTPWGRWATPKEIASVLAFLASDEADFMTGVIVPVDGGLASFIDLGREYREFDVTSAKVTKK